MKLKPTEQQKHIIEMCKEKDTVKIVAGAGAAKSTTLAMVAEEIIEPSLYLSFNRALAEEAKTKFPKHVECRSTHSLAFGYKGRNLSHKLNRPTGAYVNVAITGKEVAMHYRLSPIEYEPEKYITSTYIGTIIKETVNKFEHSADSKVSRDHIPYSHTKEIKKLYGDKILKKITTTVFKYAKKLWNDRKNVESGVACTHDTYLKLFQLSKPKLRKYKVIYLDEIQDANDCLLDIIKEQIGHTKIVLVGDDFQQIYQWRGSVNALSKVEADQGTLSKSFRFGQKVADIANVVLGGAFTLEGFEEIESITTIDDKVIDEDEHYTIIFRTNMSLVFKGLSLIESGKSVNIDFDTRDFINKVTSAKALCENEMHKVKHPDLLQYPDWLTFVGEANHDRDLKRLVDIVNDEDRLHKIIDILTKYRKPKNPDITLITAHRSKGREWDTVCLDSSFPSNYNNKGEFVGLSEAERNLLYVACTRAKKVLQYNQTVKELLDFTSSVQ